MCIPYEQGKYAEGRGEGHTSILYHENKQDGDSTIDGNWGNINLYFRL